ncbi:MAG: hypothetical protein WA979_11840, partial [Pacificimonas sp.]
MSASDTRRTPVRTAHIGAREDGERLDRALALALPDLSRERLKALMKDGAVTGPGGVQRQASRRVG